MSAARVLTLIFYSVSFPVIFLKSKRQKKTILVLNGKYGLEKTDSEQKSITSDKNLPPWL